MLLIIKLIMYTNIMHTECCICLNDIETDDIFRLECCNNVVHHDCIISWINSSIDKKFSDYNKCVLCKIYNKSIDDYYQNILSEREIDNYENLDNSNNHLVILVESGNIINRDQRITIKNKCIFICTNIIFIFSMSLCMYLLFINML
jgi:hypothetical protein